MKKIKLKFRYEIERFAFYDICWCEGHNFIQCATCARNKDRYENWQPPGCYTAFVLSGDRLEDAKNGECHMYEKDCKTTDKE